MPSSFKPIVFAYNTQFHSMPRSLYTFIFVYSPCHNILPHDIFLNRLTIFMTYSQLTFPIGLSILAQSFKIIPLYS